MTDTNENINVDLSRRISHTIAFKLDVCSYFTTVPNATVTGASRFFNITRKQVRYFRKNEENYRAMNTRRQRRNVIRPDQIRMRAMYPEQEAKVFNWFCGSRLDG